MARRQLLFRIRGIADPPFVTHPSVELGRQNRVDASPEVGIFSAIYGDHLIAHRV